MRAPQRRTGPHGHCDTPLTLDAPQSGGRSPGQTQLASTSGTSRLPAPLLWAPPPHHHAVLGDLSCGCWTAGESVCAQAEGPGLLFQLPARDRSHRVLAGAGAGAARREGWVGGPQAPGSPASVLLPNLFRRRQRAAGSMARLRTHSTQKTGVRVAGDPAALCPLGPGLSTCAWPRARRQAGRGRGRGDTSVRVTFLPRTPSLD